MTCVCILLLLWLVSEAKLRLSLLRIIYSSFVAVYSIALNTSVSFWTVCCDSAFGSKIIPSSPGSSRPPRSRGTVDITYYYITLAILLQFDYSRSRSRFHLVRSRNICDHVRDFDQSYPGQALKNVALACALTSGSRK